MTSPTLAGTLGEVQRTLDAMAARGVKGFDVPPETLAILSGWDDTKTPDRQETLDEVRTALGECQRCRLCDTRKNLVFGAGDPRARLVFVGEAPGYDEDMQGSPFVGAAGQLLTKIIQAMGMTREKVYICNILKCRPPGNRNPLPEEIDRCIPFLERQLAAISPDCICALGKFAAQTLLGTDTPISRLRGRFAEYNGIRLMPTYHPAFLLRNPERKRDVWNDIQQIMNVLNLKASGK